MLKRVLVLRKLGFCVSEIRALENGEADLNDTLKTNIKRLEEEIEELRGALEVSRRVEAEGCTYDRFYEEKYWATVTDEEKRGMKFTDVCKDYLHFEKTVFDGMFDSLPEALRDLRTKFGVEGIALAVLIFCLCRGIGRKFIRQGSFIEGFIEPLILFLLISAVLLPLYLISLKSKKAAGFFAVVIAVAGILILAAIFIFIVVLILNSIFGFLR